MNDLEFRKKSKYEKFKEKIKDNDELYHILYEKFIEIENLKNRVRYLDDLIKVNLSSKRLIEPCKEFVISSNEDIIYVPKKLKKKVETVEIFEGQNN